MVFVSTMYSIWLEVNENVLVWLNAGFSAWFVTNLYNKCIRQVGGKDVHYLNIKIFLKWY